MALSISEIASLLHLNEASADVYLELLVNGELSSGQIAKLTGRKVTEVEEAAEELIQRSFATISENTEGQKIFRAMSLMQVEERLERDKQSFKNLQKFIIPQVQSPDKLEILKYEGWEGIRQVYVEVLEEAIKTGEDIYAFESNVANSEIGDKFLDEYVARRIENEVQAYVICPTNELDFEYAEEYQDRCTEVKLIKNFKIDAHINIVGELVMAFSTDNPRGVLRRNRAEANTLRTVFKKLWDKN